MNDDEVLFSPNSKSTILGWLGVDTGPIYRPTKFPQCFYAACRRHLVPTMPIEPQQCGLRAHGRKQLYAWPDADEKVDEGSWRQALALGGENILNVFLWPLILIDTMKYALFGLIDWRAKAQVCSDDKLYYAKTLDGKQRCSDPVRSALKAFVELFCLFLSAPFRLFALAPDLLGKCINILSHPKEASAWQLTGAGFGILIFGAVVAAIAKVTAGVAYLPKVLPAVKGLVSGLVKAVTFGTKSLGGHVATVTAKLCLFGTAIVSGLKLLGQGKRERLARD